MRFTHFLEVNGPFIILGKREGLRIISSTCLETSWRRLFYKQMRLEYSQSTETSLTVIVFTTEQDEFTLIDLHCFKDTFVLELENRSSLVVAVQLNHFITFPTP